MDTSLNTSYTESEKNTSIALISALCGLVLLNIIFHFLYKNLLGRHARVPEKTCLQKVHELSHTDSEDAGDNKGVTDTINTSNESCTDELQSLEANDELLNDDDSGQTVFKCMKMKQGIPLDTEREDCTVDTVQ